MVEKTRIGLAGYLVGPYPRRHVRRPCIKHANGAAEPSGRWPNGRRENDENSHDCIIIGNSSSTGVLLSGPIERYYIKILASFSVHARSTSQLRAPAPPGSPAFSFLSPRPPNHRFCQRGICIAKRSPPPPPPSFCSTLPRKLQKSCTGLGYLFVWRRFTISGTTPYDWRPIFSTRRWYVRFRTQFTRVSWIRSKRIRDIHTRTRARY